MALAEHLQVGGEDEGGAFGILRALDQVFHKLAVAHHVSWNQNGAEVFSATSSIEQMDMVDRENGTPNFSSRPRGVDFAVGPGHTGKSRSARWPAAFHFCPIISLSSERPSMFTSTRWRNSMGAKSVVLAW